MVTIRETRVHNPNRALGRGQTAKRAKGKRASNRKRKRSTNPSLMLLGPVNPNKGGPNKMAKAKRKAKRNTHRAASAGTRKSRRRNPRNTAATRRHRRRNPGGNIGKLSNMMLLGFWVVVGLALTRQIPQLLLGTRNTGAMGYLANIATAVAAAWAANSVGGEKAAMGAGAGGGAYVITRAVQEHMSPIGKYLALQGLGDAMAMGEILTGDRTYFPLPVAYDNNRNPVIPSQIRPMAPALLPAPVSMGAYRRRVAM